MHILIWNHIIYTYKSNIHFYNKSIMDFMEMYIYDQKIFTRIQHTYLIPHVTRTPFVNKQRFWFLLLSIASVYPICVVDWNLVYFWCQTGI